MMESLKNVSTDELWKLAGIYKDKQKYPEAISVYREILLRTPSSTVARDSLSVILNDYGSFLKGIGDFSGAECEYFESMKMNSSYSFPMFNVGSRCLENNNNNSSLYFLVSLKLYLVRCTLF